MCIMHQYGGKTNLNLLRVSKANQASNNGHMWVLGKFDVNHIPVKS